MANYKFHLFFYISCILALSLSLSCTPTDEDRKVYVVYMGSLLSGEDYSPTSHHLSLLQEVTGHSSAANLLTRSYSRSFNGFAAKLTNEEAMKLASRKEVFSVFPSTNLKLQTTRSWDFMGFNDSIKRVPTVESNVIIGVIDSGITPESESFSDKGFGPPPKKWKGKCNGGENFACNNKLIGTRVYNSEVDPITARDHVGHGTHTASTAAGNRVNNVSFYGLAQGTARGGVPSARIAAYKACVLYYGCPGYAVLAAFDDAIADGVDIITVSLGYDSPLSFYQDTIAIGAFHAMEKGILTVNAAGNSGLEEGAHTASVAPWLLSVAASSIDRQFIDKVVLGNGKVVTGYSINAYSSDGTKLPLIHGKDATGTLNCSESLADCDQSCLDGLATKGKILVCNKYTGVFPLPNRRSVAGAILKNDSFGTIAFVTSIPASSLIDDGFDLLWSYVKSTKNPKAEILKSEVTKDSTAPMVASFSSRGPNMVLPDILKPDLTAPGVEILAAYSPIAPISEDTTDPRHVEYNVLSGTSMACPHVAGIAAYVKTFHPDWSPSAIKSALMTTAWPMDRTKSWYAEFAYGSGHVNPVKAIHPGLVYEAFGEDYIKLLCSIDHYDDNKIRVITGDNTTCPKGSRKLQPMDLNYPSFTASVQPRHPFNVTFHRTVTNVGRANSTYKAKVFTNSKLNVIVSPSLLAFSSVYEKKFFKVTVTGKAVISSQLIASATLLWSDGTHNVRSPIIIQNASLKA